MKSFDEFDRLLSSARAEIDRLHAADPLHGPLAAVRRQLADLHGWTRGGRCPSAAEKAQLSFGMIASRELEDVPVAAALYELASFVMYWEAKGR